MSILAGVRAGFGAVRRSKRLLALVSLCNLLVALPAGLYVFSAVHGAASTRTDSLDLARGLDAGFLAELRSHHEVAFDSHLLALVVGAALVFFLVRPLVQGGYVMVASTGRRVRFGEFVRAGGMLYWKFLRLAVIALVTAVVLKLAAKPMLAQVRELSLAMDDVATGTTYIRVAESATLLLLVVAATVYDFTRVGMRMHRRRGVLTELGHSFLFALQRPVLTLGLALISIALEVGVLWGAAAVLGWMDGGYLVTSLAILVVVQAMIAAREGCRLFVVAAAWRVRALEEAEPPPTPVAKPWEGVDLFADLPWHEDGDTSPLAADPLAATPPGEGPTE